ncbi:SH3 domain-containing protein 19 isoform X2 [Tenrec ecaudatus]|uniref:SH3 domain-containing protein 19 isoform X2 n=1 Tax=Tenrec ecaudatus TaxID=94439 RepID=UPI003F5A367B
MRLRFSPPPGWRATGQISGELAVTVQSQDHRRSSDSAGRAERGPPPWPQIATKEINQSTVLQASRTATQNELHRDRRRPEITIVAAEPLRPTSWFPGGPSPALGFPPPSSGGPWRPSELIPAELPPSYEQVIKEINQVQVNTTNNNNATAFPRHTVTSATQTDFAEEIDNHLPQTLQSPLKPSPAVTTNAAPLIVFDTPEEQTCPETLSAPRCPVPRPRSKGNLRPVARKTHIKEPGPQKTSDRVADGAPPPSQPQSLLDGNDLDSQVVANTMNTERSQNSIVSRVQAFEGQINTETSGLPKKPEIAPRTVPPRPGVSSGKPAVAPKPAASRASGEWDSWTENRLKVAPREGSNPHPPPQEAGSIPLTKPELPKKPNPGLTRSANPELLRGGATAKGPDGGKKAPTPAPRPLLPKKSVSLENTTCLSPKPATTPPGLSAASQAKAFKSLGEGPPAGPLGPLSQSQSLGDIDLISFDDEVLPSPLGRLAEEPSSSEMVLDPFQLPTKREPAKEPVVQPAPTRKPTVIRIPAKPGKCLHDDPQSPPPLPAEKPIGNTNSTASGKLSDVDRTRHLESEQAGQAGGSVRGPPRLPPRPVNGKVTPARQGPPREPPKRPPPPKLSAAGTSCKKLPLNRSSSDMDLQRKHSHVASGLSKAKSQVLKAQDPVLPPRPKPGHPLYRKYMLSVPHGMANEDIVEENPREISCKREDVLVTLTQEENHYLECQRGEDPGRVHLSQLKTTTPRDEHLQTRPKDPSHPPKPADRSAPHAVVLHDFPAEQADDLNLISGEIVYLLEKVDADWYRGRCRHQIGLFPANYVKVIIDIPEGRNGSRGSVSSHGVKGARCVARFEYIGDQKDELSFSEGEVILLTEHVNEDWARGELRGRTGIFPVSFVELVEEAQPAGAGAVGSKPTVLPLKTKSEDSGLTSQDAGLSGEWCEALHSFIAETSEDLAFKRGDRILVLGRLDSNWYRGRLQDREGTFPAVFVRPCPGGATSGSRASSPREAEGKTLPAASLKGRKAKALFDFHGEHEDELSLKAGDVLTELEPVDDEWMSGELLGKSGIFPKNYIQFLQGS